jgi:hypothetical protein
MALADTLPQRARVRRYWLQIASSSDGHTRSNRETERALLFCQQNPNASCQQAAL